MLRANFTDIVVLLDRSASMRSSAEATRSSFNEFLESQKLVEGEARLTMAQFAGPADFSYAYKNTPLGAVTGLNEYNYNPNGGSTALRDAMGKLIDERGSEYADLPEHLRPRRVVFVVITDAQDNASYRYTRGAIQERVKHQTDIYNWQFIYLGADHDAVLSAENLGILRDYALNYAKSSESIAYTSSVLSNKTAMLRNSAEYKVSFTAEERARAIKKD